MKLVTFDEGRTGRVDGDTVVELDCGSTREYFERGGNVAETGERLPLASVRLRAPIVPKKFFHTAGNFTERRRRDDLPAPLGPISPTISPSSTVRLTPSTAVTPP